MRPVPGLLLTGAGVVTLCASGCLGPMYNPYGNWGAPGYSNYNYPAVGTPGMGSPYYGAPGGIQTLTPGPQYIPGGTINSAPATGPTPTFGPNSSAPPFGGSNAPVPNPSDPGPYYPGTGENYQLPNSGASAREALFSEPFSQAERNDPSAAPGGAAGPYLQPVSMGRTAVSASSPAGDYDPQDYAWVAGTVMYDPAARTWSIVYAEQPRADDRFSGRLVLAASPLLQTLRSGERVRLEGTLVPKSQDDAESTAYQAVRIIRTAA